MIDNLANISICTLLIIASVCFVSNVDWNIQEVKPKCFHLMDPNRAILVAITQISVFADCVEIPASVEVFPNSLGRVACLIWIYKLVCQLQSPSDIYSVLSYQISPYMGLLFSLRHREVLSQHHWLVSPEDTTDLMWPCVLGGPWGASSRGVMLVLGSARKQRNQWCSLSFSYLSGFLWLLRKEDLEDLICLEVSWKTISASIPKGSKIKSFEWRWSPLTSLFFLFGLLSFLHMSS